MKTQLCNAEKREIIRRSMEFKVTTLTKLAKEIDIMRTYLERSHCGCWTFDCSEHGAYIPENIEFISNLIEEAYEDINIG